MRRTIIRRAGEIDSDVAFYVRCGFLTSGTDLCLFKKTNLVLVEQLPLNDPNLSLQRQKKKPVATLTEVCRLRVGEGLKQRSNNRRNGL